MGPVVGVDLGKRVAGIALVVDGVLVAATEISAPPGKMAQALAAWGLSRAESALWVAETMLDYSGKGARRRDLEHLRELSADIACRVRAEGHRYRRIRASAWKGAVPKPICQARIERLLSPAEMAAFDITGKESFDAVGIALYTCGRADRGMVAPRRST